MNDFHPLELQPVTSGAPFTFEFPKKEYRGPRPVVLLILDGWGIGPANAGNAITRAHTPNINRFWSGYPHTQLTASGEAVGLPHGEDGNTETGHLNIGAGSIIYQDLPRINMAIADGSFDQTPAFHNAFEHVREHDSALHLMGLIGSGAVHAHTEHLIALLNLCHKENISRVFIHGFTDGRDSPPTAGVMFVQQITDTCQRIGVGQFASVMGRYFAMDRDKRWERVEKAYNALTQGTLYCEQDLVAAIHKQYDNGVTDEFIEPINLCEADGQPRIIRDNDAVIFFNYRIDRPRELTRAFVLKDFETSTQEEAFDPYAIEFENSHLHQKPITGKTFTRQRVLQNLHFVTMTQYEDNLPVDVAFPPTFVKEPLGRVLAENGLHQLRMAETEKEKFVTFYLNGQRNEIFPGEDHIILPSKGAKSYDEIPEMSAKEITYHMLENIRKNVYDVIICNFANADMVGHTGNLQATIRACEVLDDVIGQIVQEVQIRNGVVMITADHGNAEELIDAQTGEVDTEHSTNPVPLMIIGKQFLGRGTTLPSGILADVAPTMLSVMGLRKPETMTGRALI